MEYIAVLLVAALVFGACCLIDLGFRKLFRNQQEHRSGLAVRLNKKYGSIGLILAVLGIAALFEGGWVLVTGGCLLVALGIGLVVYYMTFGVFYDTDSFVLTTFGKRSRTYAYKDIQAQQLYNSYGSVVIELYMTDGRTAQLQTGMVGACDFLDYAAAAWQRQTGRKQEDCGFYDPQNSCWFPPVEG
ncbi:MAG: hypothetical protein IJO04_02840 [Oscillospiraceae bacterium]|nr:hypothetical protein [Oscillospiraceae bacterium]